MKSRRTFRSKSMHLSGLHNDRIHAPEITAGFYSAPRAAPISRELKIAGEKWLKNLESSCACKSGLPILSKQKINGKWIAHCKKCKPKPYQPPSAESEE